MSTDGANLRTMHSLEEGALEELLRSLAIEGRSGAITIATTKGYGEIRLVEGDVVDAAFSRLEGAKAVVRLLGERDGTASFSPGSPALVRRMNVPTNALIEEARTAAARAADIRARSESLATGMLAAAVDADSDELLGALDEQLHTRLRVPAELAGLLDELPQPDADILEALLRLHERGLVKIVGPSAHVQLCGPDQLHLVRSSAERAKSAGFRGAARVVFAATAAKLAVLGHTVLSLADSRPPAEPAPSLPIPHTLSTLHLGEGVELDVVALPLIPVYAPLWPMILAGAAVTIRIDDGAAEALDEACGAVGVTILEATAVFGVVDESSAVQVASLIRTALEADPHA